MITDITSSPRWLIALTAMRNGGGCPKSKDSPGIFPGKTKACYTISMSKGVSDKIPYKPYD
ncbi:MAG: hypothetical protein LBL43_08570, partial [Treponema sp.]|nr:hypothetical protein [Treponema sp.]